MVSLSSNCFEMFMIFCFFRSFCWIPAHLHYFSFFFSLQEADTQREIFALGCFFPADLVFQNCCARGSGNDKNREQSTQGKTGVMCQEKWRLINRFRIVQGLILFYLNLTFTELREIRLREKKRRVVQLKYLLFVFILSSYSQSQYIGLNLYFVS